MAITREMFHTWKSDPVTKELFQALENMQEQVRENAKSPACRS